MSGEKWLAMIRGEGRGQRPFQIRQNVPNTNIDRATGKKVSPADVFEGALQGLEHSEGYRSRDFVNALRRRAGEWISTYGLQPDNTEHFLPREHLIAVINRVYRGYDSEGYGSLEEYLDDVGVPWEDS